MLCVLGVGEDSEQVWAPVALRVLSPNGQQKCAGDYELVPGERPNGQPLWRKTDGKRWLFSSKTQKWCIGGKDVREKNFQVTAGWIYHGARHGGAMPDEVRGTWARWDGTSFEDDSGIAVRPGELPSIGGDGTTMSMPIGASPGSLIDVAIECVCAAGVDVDSLVGNQRCLAKCLAVGHPWAIGLRQQPQMFDLLAGVLEDWPSASLFELAWEPPDLYIRKPALGLPLMVGPAHTQGSPLRQCALALWRDTEIGLCAVEGGDPRIILRIHRDSAALQAAAAAGLDGGTLLGGGGRTAPGHC